MTLEEYYSKPLGVGDFVMFSVFNHDKNMTGIAKLGKILLITPATSKEETYYFITPYKADGTKNTPNVRRVATQVERAPPEKII